MSKSILKILLRVFALIVTTIFVYLFLANPHRVYQGDNVLFQNRKIYFSERLTYLFRQPRVGDLIVFFNDEIVGSLQTEYIGLIVDSASIPKFEGDNSITYKVVSQAKSSQPWIVTANNIIGRVYYPSVSPKVISEILENRLWTKSPGTVSSLPLAGTRKYESQSPPPGWSKYEDDEYSFYYPPSLKQGSPKAVAGGVFLSPRDSSDSSEIFIRKIFVKNNQSIAETIWKDTGLSSVPTFSTAIVNSVSGWEIKRNVDNLNQYLRVIYLPRGNSVYAISMRTPSPMKDGQYEDIFEKLVSSFNFIY